MKKHKYYYRDKTKICIKNFIKMRTLYVLKKNFKISNTLRQKIMLKSFNVNKLFNLNKLKKYCTITGRLRFIIKNHKMSRIVLRELTSKGLISGMFKK